MPNGSLVPLLKANKFWVTCTSCGEPKSCQEVEDRILIGVPSSLTIHGMGIL